MKTVSGSKLSTEHFFHSDKAKLIPANKSISIISQITILPSDII